jgi:hypothetical protein
MQGTALCRGTGHSPDYLSVSFVSGKQAIKRLELAQCACFKHSSCVPSEESAQPLTQTPRLLGHRLEGAEGIGIGPEIRCDRCVYRLGALEPIDEISAIRQPLDPRTRRRGGGIDEIQREMIAEEERRRSRIGKCGHPFPKNTSP